MKMQYEYANTKLASIPLSLLLIVAGLFGFVLLVPLSAHATTAALKLSSTSATVGGSVTITGTGFKSMQPLEITSAIGTTTIPWLTFSACTPSVSYGNTGTSGTDSLVIGNCLSTDADGSFMTTVTVPPLPGGPNTITVYDGTNTVTATLTITSSIVLCSDTSVVAPKTCPTSPDNDVISSAYPQMEAGPMTILITGFASDESVSLSSSLLPSSVSLSCTTGNALNTYGICTISTDFAWADAAGGAHSFTATGATSGFTASESITVTPWVSFYNQQACTATSCTTFSFVGTSPTSVLMEGHGFAASATIPANTVTIGGVATSHSAITTDAYGVFGGGAGNHIVLAPTTQVPYGQVSVVVAGTTFNYANGNINEGNGVTWPAVDDGVLLSSAIGTATSTAIASLDATTHTFGDTPAYFIVGAAVGATVTVSVTNLPGITSADIGRTAGTIESATNGAISDANGAWFTTTIAGSLGAETAGTYTVTFTTGTVANVLSPSYTTTPDLSLGFDTGTCGSTDYRLNLCGASPSNDQTAGANTINGYMFAGTTTTTVTAGGNTLLTATTDSSGSFSGALSPTGTCPACYYSAIDLAQGTWTATASDGTNTGTDTFAIIPIVDNLGGSALTTTSGNAGSTTNLRTAANFGVHGLKANTAYSLNWGMVGATGAHTLGMSFTSTSTGGIPVPGMQVTLPADVTGDHLITLTQAGTDALFGVTFQNTVSSAGPTTNYGDLVYVLTTTGTIAPSAVNVGETFTISGTALQAGTTYEETISADSSAAGATGQIFGTFTTDATGNIPPLTTLAMPILNAGTTGAGIPAAGAINAGPCNTVNTYYEQATSYTLHFSTASEYPGTQDGSATIVLQAKATTNMTSAPAGHAFLLTSGGLCASATYNIVFNYGINPQATAYTGIVIGAFGTNTNGQGSATVTVPAGTAGGTYPISLVRVAPTSTALGVLAVTPTITVTAAVASCTNLGTSCFTATGSPSKTTIGQFTGISVTYTNGATGAVTGIVYAVVHNAAGQTVYYTTATISPSAGSSANAFLVLSGLPAGTYTVSLFATDTSGNAISTSTSTSVTLP